MYYFSVNQRPRFLYMTAQLDSLSSLKFGEHTTIAPPLHCKVFVGLGLKRGGEAKKFRRWTQKENTQTISHLDTEGKGGQHRGEESFQYSQRPQRKEWQPRRQHHR